MSFKQAFTNLSVHYGKLHPRNRVQLVLTGVKRNRFHPDSTSIESEESVSCRFTVWEHKEWVSSDFDWCERVEPVPSGYNQCEPVSYHRVNMAAQVEWQHRYNEQLTMSLRCNSISRNVLKWKMAQLFKGFPVTLRPLGGGRNGAPCQTEVSNNTFAG